MNLLVEEGLKKVFLLYLPNRVVEYYRVNGALYTLYSVLILCLSVECFIYN